MSSLNAFHMFLFLFILSASTAVLVRIWTSECAGSKSIGSGSLRLFFLFFIQRWWAQHGAAMYLNWWPHVEWFITQSEGMNLSPVTNTHGLCLWKQRGQFQTVLLAERRRQRSGGILVLWWVNCVHQAIKVCFTLCSVIYLKVFSV